MRAELYVRLDVDAVLTLYDPTGVKIMSTDTDSKPVLVVIAEQNGSYRLEATRSGANIGQAELAVLAVRRSLAQDRLHVDADRRFRTGLHLKRDPKSRRVALEELSAAAEGFGQAGEPGRQAGALLRLGLVHSQIGDLRAALTATEQALNLNPSGSEEYEQTVAHGNIGFLLEALGEPVRARASYLAALERHRLAGRRSSEALMLNNLGHLEQAVGNPSVALAFYRQALTLFQEIGHKRREGLVLQNMGTVHAGLGEFETAEGFLQAALPLHRSTGDRLDEARTLTALARQYMIRSQFERAIDHYRQALIPVTVAGDRMEEAEIRSRLGHALATSDRHREAEAALEQALALASGGQDRRRRSNVLELSARASLLGLAPAQAVTRATEALQEYRALGIPLGQIRALDTLARAHDAQNEPIKARKHIEEALAILEESRMQAGSPETRASYFATQQDAFSFYIDLLMRLRTTDPQAPAQALAAVERYRARSLLDLLSESGVDIRQGVDPKLLAQEQDLVQRLNAKAAVLLSRSGAEAARLKEEIRVADEEYRQVQAAIRQASPAYAALTQPRPLTLREIQGELLDEQTTLLEYSLGEKRSYLWAVRKNSLAFWELPACGLIEPQVERVHQLLTARALSPRGESEAARRTRLAAADAELATASRALGQQLLPAGALVAGQRLVVVPDGTLQKLPFAMLPVAGGEPLGIQHELSVVPSATALALQRKLISGRTPAPKMLAVFADPEFAAGATATDPGDTRILEHLADAPSAAGGRPRVPPLPFTRTEAREILAVARGRNLSALGRDATRERALQPDLATYRYLHFATHGYLDAERPGLSALLLSRDGFLRVNDIYNMRLPAELVVLSACQTGLGKEVRGEGLMSFTRAFMYAGAPRVIVSLWNVNDRATASLMTTLYRKMLRTGLTPPAALRQAQIELRKQKQWASPYYWAAFVHFGEWK